ncbi:MAG TPA: hypothetical protein VIL74_20680 [Pyrinomonadaceae bacterium]|jgi:hypothetical protein
MIGFSIKKNFTKAQIAKQLPFATAKALTATAKDAQKDVVDSLDDKFTLRNNWWKPNTPLGIKVRSAKKTNLQAEVGTNFDALEKFETGKDKIPFGRYIAIPTSNVRRNKRQIIQKGQRPKNLRRAFILVTRKNKVPMLFQRRGRGRKSDIFAMYRLEERVKIRKNSPVVEPALKSIRANLNKNFMKSLDEALRTAK